MMLISEMIKTINNGRELTVETPFNFFPISAAQTYWFGAK